LAIHSTLKNVIALHVLEIRLV